MSKLTFTECPNSQKNNHVMPFESNSGLNILNTQILCHYSLWSNGNNHHTRRVQIDKIEGNKVFIRKLYIVHKLHDRFHSDVLDVYFSA